MEPAPARRQVVTAYAAYLGWQELRRASSDVVPETAAAALEHLITELAHD